MSINGQNGVFRHGSRAGNQGLVDDHLIRSPLNFGEVGSCPQVERESISLDLVALTGIGGDEKHKPSTMIS